MTEDTRKDSRTKFVSLNVRFKSANVEEFIDNHSYDISRGGLFVKTSSPFASGTLLKFEIRLAADEPVIAGVGRVVWKRETSQATPDRPAGMGVKFIKVDDKSRDLIERLVAQHGSAGGAYEAGERATEGAVNAPKGAPPIDAPAAAEARPASVPPGAATSINRTVPSAGSVPPPMPASMPPMPALNTTVPQSPAAKATERAPAAQAGGFFPETDSVGDMPAPEERTVMRQASELLEVALKAAGGSLEELGKLEPAKPVSAPAATVAEVPAPEAKSDAPHEAAPAATEQVADVQQAPAAEAAAIAAAIPPPAKSGSSGLAALFDDMPVSPQNAGDDALDGSEAKSAAAVADAPAAAATTATDSAAPTDTRGDLSSDALLSRPPRSWPLRARIVAAAIAVTAATAAALALRSPTATVVSAPPPAASASAVAAAAPAASAAPAPPLDASIAAAVTKAPAPSTSQSPRATLPTSAPSPALPKSPAALPDHL
jgi:hypothetical protein